MILVDTNIMLRLLEPRQPQCTAAIDAIAHLTTNVGETFCTIPHCLHEVYHVLTREKNGHGKAPQAAIEELNQLAGLFPIQPDTDQVFLTWLQVVAQHNVKGRLAYDAKIVAAMIEHRIPAILTFNDTDFRRFNQITAMNPFDVISRPRV